MRDELLALIRKTSDIRQQFQTRDFMGTPGVTHNLIYDVPEFIHWKQKLLLELQNIHKSTHDTFIWDTIVIIKQGFNGWKDEVSFNNLAGALIAIESNIDKYYPLTIKAELNMNTNVTPRASRVFISHSSKDIIYVKAIVELLENIGLSHKQIFCSSVPGYGIPLDDDIFEYLKKQLNDYVHVIYVLSNNYYESATSLNEMGAAWISQKRATNILLPGFEFEDIKGVANRNKIAVKLDGLIDELKFRLRELQENLLEGLGMEPILPEKWERKRDEFIAEIQHIRFPK